MSDLHDFFKSRDIDRSDVVELSGGDVNQVFATENTVFKINNTGDYPCMFEAEAKGLNELRKGIRTPFVLDQGTFRNLQFLQIELIAEGIRDEHFWIGFGAQLALVHQQKSEHFGLDHDNYIGSLRQFNNYKDSWFNFLIENRLQPMVEMAVNSGEVNYVESKPFENLYRKLQEIYPEESPALLHGDLWSGNFLCAQNGEAVLIDPATYYGHREMDIGMMHLFGGFDPVLFETYNDINPLEVNWKSRIKINQIYPLLVHVNLFGRTYWSKVQSIIKPFQ